MLNLEEERILEFLTDMNIIIELHYARLLSIKTEALQAWHNCWKTDISFTENDLIWKQMYTSILDAVFHGKTINMKQDVIRCK